MSNLVKIGPVGAEFQPDGRTDMTTIIVAIYRILWMPHKKETPRHEKSIWKDISVATIPITQAS